MSDRRPTDAAVARAISDRLPASAPAGFRAQVRDLVETTSQQRPLPGMLGVLGDANPFMRRRNLLLAAALTAVLLLAALAGVGAYLEQRQRTPSLEPLVDVPAFVDQAYLSLADPPAFEMLADQDGDRHRIRSDGKGTVRNERLATGTTRLVSRDRVVLISDGDPNYPMGDPGRANGWIELGPSTSVPGTEIGASVGPADACEAPWAYVGIDQVAGRPVHHIACGVEHHWVDAETKLVLRSRVELAAPDVGAPVSVAPEAAPSAAAIGDRWEVVDLRVGPQPAELFLFEPPAGYPVIGGDDAECLTVWFAECRDPGASDAPARPYAAPPPAPGNQSAPPDVAAFAAEVAATYAQFPALEMEIEHTRVNPDEPASVQLLYRSRHASDGAGRYRTELPGGGDPTTVYIDADGHVWHSWHLDGGERWRDDWGPYADRSGLADAMFGFTDACEAGWRFVATDLVLDRPANHITCANLDYWVDVERRFVLRSEIHPTDPLQLTTEVSQATELSFDRPPADLFRLPPGAVIEPRP